VAEGANINYARRSYCVPESKIIVCSRKSSKCRWCCNFRIRNVSKFIAIELSEEVDQKLKEIMLNIHSSCVKYGSDSNGYVDYVKGANIAGFVKWLTLCLLKEWYKSKLNAFYHSDILELSRNFGYSKTEYFGLYYICES
jgi:hypothetical protein